MINLRSNISILLLSLLLCFSNLAVADSSDDQEQELQKNQSSLESEESVCDISSHSDNDRRIRKPHGGDGGRKCNKKWHCGHVDRDGRMCGRKCKKMKVRLCTKNRRINWGESATLKWKCRRTESCELIPDIGPLDHHGSGTLNVSPKKTTQYTLIGKRRGCVVRSSVTIRVCNIPPPMTITEPAEGAGLTLSTTHTIAVVIDFTKDTGIDIESFKVRINNQDITDQFTVTDTGATADLSMRLQIGSNTLSATICDADGRCRTVNRRFTISYIPPTVSLSADPQTVDFGESTTLSWQALNADKVTIEPGFGEVGLNDSMVVELFEETTFTITAEGPGGTVSSSVAVDIASMPPAGIYYKYDELGRVKHIVRMPQQRTP